MGVSQFHENGINHLKRVVLNNLLTHFEDSDEFVNRPPYFSWSGGIQQIFEEAFIVFCNFNVLNYKIIRVAFS